MVIQTFSYNYSQFERDETKTHSRFTLINEGGNKTELATSSAFIQFSPFKIVLKFFSKPPLHGIVSKLYIVQFSNLLGELVCPVGQT